MPSNGVATYGQGHAALKWTNPQMFHAPFVLASATRLILMDQGHLHIFSSSICVSPSSYTLLLQLRWAAIASQLPGRTDNEIKNYWNTQLKKRLPRPGHSRGAQQSSFSPDHSTIVKTESPSTRHMVQWESARVEAEARLSMESSLLNSWSTSETYPDHFLQLWHSEVGQSFRMIKGKEGGVVCQSSVSQSSSSSKLESCSDVSLQDKNTGSSAFANMTGEQDSSYKPKLEDGKAGSDSGYYEFLDTSDSALSS